MENYNAASEALDRGDYGATAGYAALAALDTVGAIPLFGSLVAVPARLGIQGILRSLPAGRKFYAQRNLRKMQNTKRGNPEVSEDIAGERDPRLRANKGLSDAREKIVGSLLENGGWPDVFSQVNGKLIGASRPGRRYDFTSTEGIEPSLLGLFTRPGPKKLVAIEVKGSHADVPLRQHRHSQRIKAWEGLVVDRRIPLRKGKASWVPLGRNDEIYLRAHPYALPRRELLAKSNAALKEEVAAGRLRDWQREAILHDLAVANMSLSRRLAVGEALGAMYRGSIPDTQSPEFVPRQRQPLRPHDPASAVMF